MFTHLKTFMFSFSTTQFDESDIFLTTRRDLLKPLIKETLNY